jgi:hypothetical protein
VWAELRSGARLPAPAVDPDEAGQVARDILGRREYRPPERSVLQRAWDWFWERLGELLPTGLGEGGAGGYWVGVVVLVVATSVAVWLLWRHVPRRRARRRRAPSPVEVATVEPPARRELLRLAERAEAEGRWDDAVTYRFRALVAGLAARRLVPGDPSATTGELRQHLRGDDQASVGFDEVSVRYEEVRYGGDPATAEDPRRIADWDRQLVGPGR